MFLKKRSIYLDKKYYKNIKAFIYGKNYKFFKKKLKGKIFCNNSRNINEALKKYFYQSKKKNFNLTQYYLVPQPHPLILLKF